MQKSIAIGVFVAVLTGSASYAQEDEHQACMDQLAKTESLVDERVNAKALDEGEVEDVNMLLDEADEACTEGKFKKAKNKLTNVKKLVTPPAE